MSSVIPVRSLTKQELARLGNNTAAVARQERRECQQQHASPYPPVRDEERSFDEQVIAAARSEHIAS